MKFTWLIIGLILILISVPAGAQHAPSENSAKIIILHYSITGNTVTFLDAKVIYGYPRNPGPSGDLTGRTLGDGDTELHRFGIQDPRITYTEDGAIIAEQANFSVMVPYSEDLNSVGIYDKKDDSLLVKTEVQDVVKDFCKSHPDDPDCRKATPLSPAVAIGACMMVGGWFFLKRKKAA